jgi:magnesium-transporting ATPase (P-type)
LLPSLLRRLYVFDGYVLKPDGTKSPLSADNLLLRGCTLRKTSWVIGVTVNVGRDSKIMQNMTKAPRKVTQLEQAMNWLVILQFSVMLVLAIIIAALDQWWQGTVPGSGWYLGETGSYPELPPSFVGWCISVRGLAGSGVCRQGGAVLN